MAKTSTVALYEDKKILGRPINKKSKGQRKNLFVNLQCLLTSLLIRLVREHERFSAWFPLKGHIYLNKPALKQSMRDLLVDTRH